MPKPQPTPRQDAQRDDTKPDSVTNPPAHSFDELSQGSKEILIEYHGQLYRLRTTRNGGLILNK